MPIVLIVHVAGAKLSAPLNSPDHRGPIAKPMTERRKVASAVRSVM